MTQLPGIRTGELSAKDLLSAQDMSIQGAGPAQLYEFVLEWMRLDLTQAPGPKLAFLIQTLFGASAVAIFDASLGRLDKIGDWRADEEELARDCYLRDISQYNSRTQLSQRPLRVGPISFGALIICGGLSPLLVDILATLVAIAMERHERFEKAFRVEAADKTVLATPIEQSRTMGINGRNAADNNKGMVIHYGEIELDPARHRVLKNGQVIHLTPKEFAILRYLMQQAGKPIPHERLLQVVWGQQYGSEYEYLRTFVRQLRKKIEDDPANPRYLKVLPSIGYMFDDQQSLLKSA